ncbi:MAG TPA: V-type ATPase 116kDa subunit family protein [Kineosporiaceae bacterium]|nr:V-type ATPase 116kDa subunit family protein [Kineosporiaceae bacterium]
MAPAPDLRPVLVALASAGTVELDHDQQAGEGAAAEASLRLQRLVGGAAAGAQVSPALLAVEPDLDALEADGRVDLVAGESQLQERAAAAVRRGTVAGLTGWMPRAAVTGLATQLAPLGGAVVPLPRPRGVQPPTLLSPSRRGRAAAPLVATYATVPYADVDPTLFAALAYIVMFGVMFADAGHGLLLVVCALALRAGVGRRRGRRDRLARLRPAWGYLAAAGLVATATGVAYGEFFGPTGVLPFAAVDPLREPLLLLGLAVVAGAALLAVAYGIGTVNRMREGGWSLALYAPAGGAGATLFLGLALIIAGLATGNGWLTAAGTATALAGLVLAFAGLRAEAGPGGAGLAQAGVELFDVVVRLGSNVVSFARLAAFGMTHAALAAVVWAATVALWAQGSFARGGAVAVFLVGTVLTFALEALVAAVQALRLEYYELFSRVFQGEGTPFRPWYVPTADRSAPPGSAGPAGPAGPAGSAGPAEPAEPAESTESTEPAEPTDSAELTQEVAR